jgi:SAM-dependent methyltransferase
MDDEMADFLLSAQAADALVRLQADSLDDENLLPLLTRLRASFDTREAGALVSLARLRRRATSKFPHAERMFFTAEALEQATAATVADHHARRLDRYAPPGPVLDLGCGIGGDTLALARHRPVIAYDLDPVRLRFARANADALGLGDRVEFRCADWTEELVAGRLPQAAAAFADPARRVEGRRVFSLHKMAPPISALLALQAHIPALGVKVMPGVRDEEIPPGCGVEFIGHEGTCKEALLWFGPLAIHERWASVHLGENSSDDRQGEWRTLIAGGEPPPLGPLAAGNFLHEPHPAVIRAGAFAELCAELDAHLFDPQIAYLVSSKPVGHPLVQSFAVEEVHPYSLKRLNRRLKALGVGQVELKKRGFPVEPEQLRPRLTLTKGGRAAVIFFTRRGRERLMIIARRVR